MSSLHLDDKVKYKCLERVNLLRYDELLVLNYILDYNNCKLIAMVLHCYSQIFWETFYQVEILKISHNILQQTSQEDLRSTYASLDEWWN